MGFEKLRSWTGRAEKAAEKRAIVIRTTDKVVLEFAGRRPLAYMTPEARQLLLKIIRTINRGKKVVIAGETRARAVWINEIWFGHADAR